MSSIKYISEKTPFVISQIDDDNFVPDLEYSDHTIGDIVCYSSLYDELINKFGSYENAKNLYFLCQNLINNGGYSTEATDEKKAIPYLDLTVYLEQEMTDNGLFTPCIEKWIPGKKYYVGDLVYYSIDGTDENMIPYVLNEGISLISRIEPKNNMILTNGILTRQLVESDSYAYFHLNKEIVGGANYVLSFNAHYDEGNTGVLSFYLEGYPTIKYTIQEGYNTFNFTAQTNWNGRKMLTFDDATRTHTKPVHLYNIELWPRLYGDAQYETPSYAGFYDSGNTRLIYFDDIDANGNLVFHHWGEASTLVKKETSSEPETYETQTESMLANLKRQKVSMDDDCNVLPFITHYSMVPIVNTVYKRKELSTDETESLYRAGITNVTANSNGVVTCDYLEKIVFNGDESSLVYNDQTEPLICNDTDYADFDKITFIYYINAEIDPSNNQVAPSTGVKYVEEHSFTIEHMEATIDNIVCTGLPYFSISDDYSFAKDENEDLANSGHGTEFAEASIDVTQIGKTPFSEIPIFKDEKLNSVQDISSEIDVDIDRGIATSFERHNALGEINTMQDLEHYRNNYFDVSKQ